MMRLLLLVAAVLLLLEWPRSATAQQWALKYELISLGDDPASYFTNDYLPK